MIMLGEKIGLQTHWLACFLVISIFCGTSVSNNDAQVHETNLEANNAIVDRPMQLDLNATSTVQTLLDYGISMSIELLT